MIKDRNSKDLTEAEEIKKRWQKYTEVLYKKGLNNFDNNNGVVTNLELYIIKCEFKWALGKIIVNKVSGCDGIPAELFQILKKKEKKDTVNMLYSICQQNWKTQQWPQDWKRSVFQSQRKAMPMNAPTTSQLDSSHTLVK